MDVGLDLTESPPNGADLGVLRGRPRQHGAGSGEARWVIAWSAGAWLALRVQPRQLHSPVVLGDLALDLPVRVRIAQAPAIGEGELLQVRAVPAGERVVDSIGELFEGVAARGREDPSWPRPVLLAVALDQVDPDLQPRPRPCTPPVRSTPVRLPGLAAGRPVASPVIRVHQRRLIRAAGRRAGPVPGIPGAPARRPGQRRRGYKRPPRTGRIARSHQSATR